MKNAKEVSKELNIHFRTIKNRAFRLGFKKRGTTWQLTESQIKQIKEYEPLKQFQSRFYFSNDGEYLIVNSRMNQLEKNIIDK
jgi:hypothetical protein